MHKNICGGENGANLLCKCFLVISSRPTSPGAEGVNGGLPMLLTGILCVDECAGLTAQCAYLIGATPLTCRVSPSLSLLLTSFQSLFCWRCRARAFHLATRCSLPTLFLKGQWSFLATHTNQQVIALVWLDRWPRSAMMTSLAILAHRLWFRPKIWLPRFCFVFHYP